MSLMSLAERAAGPRKPAAEVHDAEPTAPAAPRPTVPESVTRAIDRLVEFIPTETIVLFWLAVPAVKALVDDRVQAAKDNLALAQAQAQSAPGNTALAQAAAAAKAQWEAVTAAAVHPTDLDWGVYAAGLLLTPVLLLLGYIARQAVKKDEPMPKVKEWPWWKALAATLAFAAWVLAVPGNPFCQSTSALLVAWLVAAVASTLITLLDPIVVRWCGTA
jgi:hypothetical protein